MRAPCSTRIAMIGLMSTPPSGGMIFWKGRSTGRVTASSMRTTAFTNGWRRFTTLNATSHDRMALMMIAQISRFSSEPTMK